MADWTAIPDADLQPGEPITSELMLALRDNPAAIADGTTGAPRVQLEALGAGVGVWRAIQEANITASASTIDFVHAIYADPNLVAVLFDIRFVQHANNSAYVGMRFSNNNGSTFFTSGYLHPLGHTAGPPDTLITDRIPLSEKVTGTAPRVTGGRFYVQKNVGAAQRTRVSGTAVSTTESPNIYPPFAAGGAGPLGQHPNAFQLLMNSGDINSAFVRTYALIVA